uniref:PHD-type domain-containing protein n=1 Tax=Meloidogyne incognita TaxID=6306 RepID=A0A914L3U8_MELIC
MDEQIDFYRRIYLESIWHELYLNAYKYYMAVEAIGRFEGEESFDFYQYLEKFEYSSDRVKQLYQEIVEDEVKSHKNLEQGATNNDENWQRNVNKPRDVSDAESYIAKKLKITKIYKRKNKKLVQINSESGRYNSSQTEYETGENSEQGANNFENINEYENVNTMETRINNNDNYTDNERNFLQIVEYTSDLCQPLPLAIDYSGSIYEIEYRQPNDGQVPATSYQNTAVDHFPSTSYRENSPKEKHSKTDLRRSTRVKNMHEKLNPSIPAKNTRSQKKILEEKDNLNARTVRRTYKKKTKELPRIKSATECYDFDQTDNELKDKLIKLHEKLKERKFLQREVKQVKKNNDTFEVEAILGVGFDEISEKLRFLVKWKDYNDPKYNLWLPESEVLDLELARDFIKEIAEGDCVVYKDNCGHCGQHEGLELNQAITCENCNNWVHTKCTKLDNNQVNKICNGKMDWYCQFCKKK